MANDVDTQEFFRLLSDKDAIQKAMEENPSELFPTEYKRYAAIMHKYYLYTGVVIPDMNMEGITLGDIMNGSEKFQTNRAIAVARLFKNTTKKGRPVKNQDGDDMKLIIKTGKKKTYMPACVLKTIKQNVKSSMARDAIEEITAEEEKKDLKNR